jgi:putative membrane protein
MSRHLTPDQLWLAWDWEPAVVITLMLTAALYAIGVYRLWQISNVGAGVHKGEALSFGAGWVVIALALVSPLHALGGVLFSAHMTQHEMLITIGAPLLVLGRPLVPFLWALPLGWRRRVGAGSRSRFFAGPWHALTRPSVAFGLHAVALWTWHVPRLYQATLTSELVHSLQHATFLATALLFWWTIFAVRGGELRRGLAVFYLFATVLQTGALGALLTFGGRLWYPAYSTSTLPWGLTPLDDQQLGGLIMWIPGSIAYVIAGLWMFAAWLRESERRAVQRERAIIPARLIALILAFVYTLR